MSTKIDLLKKVSLFSSLSRAQLQVIADLSRYYNFNKGDVIFENGGHREELFVIKKGEVLITRNEQQGKTSDIARFISGESFGEMELLDKEPTPTTAYAEKNTTLLIFPKKGTSLTEVMDRYPRIFAFVLHQLLAMIASRIRSTNRLISEKTPWVQDLRKQLLTDKLTAVYNRTYLEEDLPSILSKSDSNTGLIIIKPDNFKRINDNCGHQAGDRVLQLIAATIKSTLSEEHIPARFRGDEFAVILPDSRPGQALETADSLKKALTEMSIGDSTDGKITRMTFSMGISTYSRSFQTWENTMQDAFNKMWKAREEGGDRIVV
ncbi:MAG: diguanylate cyclase [Spirochaetota bacterium]